MKHYIEVEETVKKHKELVSTECDFCGNAKKQKFGEWPRECQVDHADAGSNWHQQNTEPLELNIATVYPEGGDGKAWDLDICPRCFHDKLLPLALEGRREGREYDV